MLTIHEQLQSNNRQSALVIRISEPFVQKTTLASFEVLHGSATAYLELIVRTMDLIWRQAIHSAGLCCMPPMKTSTIGSWAFPMATASSLEQYARRYITTAPSLSRLYIVNLRRTVSDCLF